MDDALFRVKRKFLVNTELPFPPNLVASLHKVNLDFREVDDLDLNEIRESIREKSLYI